MLNVILSLYCKWCIDTVLTMFTGEYEGKIDAKGRLVLPARIKARLPEASGNQLVLMRGMEPCVVLYPSVEYKRIYSHIASLNEFSEEARTLQRSFFRRVTETELDGNGRILLPKLMINYANIQKEVVVVGMGNRIEIWDPEQYDRYFVDDAAEFSSMANKFLTDN